jgi:hypothetical protein
MDSSEESELLDSAFFAQATFGCFFSFFLCLPCSHLIAFSAISILPFLPALRAIALTSLRKVRLEYGAFFSLSSFSLAYFLNFQQRSVIWVFVLQWVQYIGLDSVFVFLPLFVTLFSDFAN